MKHIRELLFRVAVPVLAGGVMAGCVAVPYDPPGYYYSYPTPVYGPPVVVAPAPVVEFSYHREWHHRR